MQKVNLSSYKENILLVPKGGDAIAQMDMSRGGGCIPCTLFFVQNNSKVCMTFKFPSTTGSHCAHSGIK